MKNRTNKQKKRLKKKGLDEFENDLYWLRAILC